MLTLRLQWTRGILVRIISRSKIKTFIVEVPDPIYAQLALDTEDDSGLVVQLQTCWATPSDDADSETSYTFLSPGQTNVDGVGIVQNCASSNAEFWIESFRFVDDGKCLIAAMS